jgi:chromate transporter
MNQHSSSSAPAPGSREASTSTAPTDHAPSSGAAAARPVPTAGAIFKGFLGLGLTSFGGALPLARRTIVERHRWLSGAEFTDLLGLCQFLPGGNVINLAVAIGMRFQGWRGALAGLLGLIAGPSLVVIGLGVLYEHTQNDPHVQHLFAGLAAAASGLLIAMAAKILMPLRRNPAAAGIAALGFIAIAVLRFPLLPTMLVLTPVSIALAAHAAARSADARGAER